jgi:hypothetical protein
MRSEMKIYIMVLSAQLQFMSDQTAVPELGNGYILPSYWNKWPEFFVLMHVIIFISLMYCYMATCWCFRFIKLLFHRFLVCIITALLFDIQDFQKWDKTSEILISCLKQKLCLIDWLIHSFYLHSGDPNTGVTTP